MRMSRYERELRQTAGPTVARFVMIAFGVAALIGLAIGIVWIIAGLLHFHPLW
jgi:hypothetical protein